MSAGHLESAPNDAPVRAGLQGNVSQFQPGKRLKGILGGLEGDVASPSDLLRDVLLPDAALTLLSDALRSAGYYVAQEQLRHAFDPQYTRRVISVRAGPDVDPPLYLIHVPPEVLENGEPEYAGPFSYLRPLFPDRCHVRVLSTGLRDTSGVYARIMRTWHDIGACFVSWQRITEFELSEHDVGTLLIELRIVDVLPAPSGGGDDSTGSGLDYIAEVIEFLDAAITSAFDPRAFVTALIDRLDMQPGWRSQAELLKVKDPTTVPRQLVTWSARLDLGDGGVLLGRVMAQLSGMIGANEGKRLWDLIEKNGLLSAAEIKKRRPNA